MYILYYVHSSAVYHIPNIAYACHYLVCEKLWVVNYIIAVVSLVYIVCEFLHEVYWAFVFCEQSLLQSHERVANEVKALSSEIERVKELSRKVIEGASTSLAFVSIGSL